MEKKLYFFCVIILQEQEPPLDQRAEKHVPKLLLPLPGPPASQAPALAFPRLPSGYAPLPLPSSHFLIKDHASPIQSPGSAPCKQSHPATQICTRQLGNPTRYFKTFNQEIALQR